MPNFSLDQISTFWSGVAATATVAAAVVAIVTLLSLRRDSRDRTRPVMMAELRPVVLVDWRIELVISNVGPSIARKVRVTFDPPLPNLDGEAAERKVTPFLRRRYREPVATWPPGMQFRNLYFVGEPGGGDEVINAEPLPDEFALIFSYEDEHGRSYRDRFELSRRLWSDETMSKPANRDSRGVELRKTKALEAIARGVGIH